jgi:hypothetical protein
VGWERTVGRSLGLCGLALSAWVGLLSVRAGDATATTGVEVNLAAFGRVFLAPVDGRGAATNAPGLASATNRSPVRVGPERSVQVEWDQPRPVRGIVIRTIEGPENATPAEQAAPGTDFEVQWWRRIWPDTGKGGWQKLDDPFNGDWTTARGTATRSGSETRFDFAPLEPAEAPGIESKGMSERRTYKVRIVPKRLLGLIEVRVLSDAVWQSAALRFEWGCRTTVAGNWSPVFTVRNGRLRGVRKAGSNATVVEIDYAATSDRSSADRALVSFRSGELRSFGVWVDEAIEQGGLWVRDVGVFVSDASRNLKYQGWAGPVGEVWPEGGVVDQVARLPDQTFAAANAALPQKPPRYLFLGVPNLRQEIALLPNGQIQLQHDSLRTPGPDADARPWTWDTLIYDFGTGEHPTLGPDNRRPVRRTLEDGWLPVVRHEWDDGDIAYTETSVAAPLTADIAKLSSTTGTEPVVLATRFELRNRAAEARTGWLWLELNHPRSLRLGMADTLLLDYPSRGALEPGRVPVRGRFDRHGQGTLDVAVVEPAGPGSYREDVRGTKGAPAVREAVRYRVQLPPGASQTLDFFVPYVETLDATEASALQTLDYAAVHESVVRYWTQRVAQSMTLEVPERWLNDFFKANLWHVLITTDIDPVTGFHEHGAATHHYKNYLNETAMVARSLEMRGEHEAARRLIEPFLECQGTRGLAGNFRSREGVLYAAHPTEPDPYTAQAYNLHHGWGLWAAAEHYLWTRDLAYLARVAPRLVAAADWIVGERQATRLTNPDGSKRIEYGLLPAGDLEDVEESLYFYAPDAYAHLGLRATADVLAQSAKALRQSAPPISVPGHAQRDRALDSYQHVANRLARDADDFRSDIRASVAESVASSPVVRLRDGSYVPWVPPRAYALTHLREGWIREALYPALHLVNGGIYDARHPFVEWIVRDLEDNVFLSAESGYGLARPREDFFNLGGFTLQPNLLDLPLVYLDQGRGANCLRAFYNAAAASLYPDMLCFAEWVPRPGEGGGPLYKTPDECKFVQWLRQLLVYERGDTLELGLGVPRAWMQDGQTIRIGGASTHFGKLDLEITSHATQGRVEAQVRLNATVRPRMIRLHLRHPENRPLRAVTIGGRPVAFDRTEQSVRLPVSASKWAVVAGF